MVDESDSNITENPDCMHVVRPVSGDINVISPLSFFSCEKTSSTSNSPVKCLLILNQEIHLPFKFFDRLWKSTSIRICADGGANRLYNYSRQNSVLNEYTPNYIVGDLDSLIDPVRDYYLSQGTRIKKQGSQFYSDLDKSIALIDLLVNFPSVDVSKLDDYSGLEKTEVDRIKGQDRPFFKQIFLLVVGGIGGRFDQTIATISRTIQSLSQRPFIDFILLNSEHAEFVLLLPKGKNFIDFPTEKGFMDEDRGDNPRNVGLLPLSGPANVTTKGLKWDVQDWRTEMIGDLSLCNYQVGDNGIYLGTSSELFVNIEF
ncbi:hypothetical protein FOA43_003044 [Brettanomyces nanus]|uniref:Thiamine pyrophosphokinase n=1 Tax=Eeniella nana TaxID=13502 RepID=A0A875S5R0_EENNA|nr:uncharacterized protein FOA43_003044 [Brettanomyces nanus]QPG75685.1 hypothetical protein FOA43_003044 [Brettanomyces nanus]